mmetsp:Transcript_28763/g.29096  ORF Transcript_28763/g.29096 Transcript_28763/m.29096 type:complete len:169 (+) Transcript_28763:65-571(+)
MNEDNETKGDTHTTSKSLRSGQWTVEEKNYATELIDLFQSGNYVIGAKNGQSVRSFLAERLYCDPMRISKKFASFEGLLAAKFLGASLNGSILLCDPNATKLQNLEEIFLVKDAIVQSNRLKRRKYSVKSKRISKIRKYNESSVSNSSTVGDDFDDLVFELDFSLFEE